MRGTFQHVQREHYAKRFCEMLFGLKPANNVVKRVMKIVALQRRGAAISQQAPLLLVAPQRKHMAAVAKRVVVVAHFFYKIQTIDDSHFSSMHHENGVRHIIEVALYWPAFVWKKAFAQLSKHSARFHQPLYLSMKPIFCYSRTMINTTTASIESLAKDQTIVLQTPTESRVLLAKPLFNALHQHFPDASFAVLETLLEKNAAFGLHIARQHHLFAMVSFVGSVRRPQLH